MFNSSRKLDKDIYNNDAASFIPIACHYNPNTLLTKDGELLQIIRIQGISSEKISDKLYNLREVVRKSIKKNVTTQDFAFWIHTIREKQNLDDTAPYTKLLPFNIHELWQQKNYWHDKFVNTLYISIIHNSTRIRVSNLNSFMASLSHRLITDFEDKYLDDALHELDSVTNNLLADLSEFDATKLGIYFEQDKSFSNLMYLYNRIINLNDDEVLVPIMDLSNSLDNSKYTISGNKIITSDDEQNKRYISLLSIKEYQETPSAILDKFLQLPIELIVTEIFHFIDKKQALSALKGQDYILTVSGDTDLIEYKEINKINSSPNLVTQFCNQQISIAIVEDDEEMLQKAVARASTELFKLGIIHIQEDINIEQTFWAQLPGNFRFIRRMTPLMIENVASFAMLYDSPFGEQYNNWGRALTLLRTEKGTPYFMNFHDKTGKGHSCIFGTEKTGKTVLLNFLISEATKYDPTIVYVSNNNDAQIFIEALEGKWLKPEKEFFNPFLLENTEKSQAFVLEFLKLISNHYVIPLTEGEISFLQKLKDKIFLLEKEKRNFSNILKSEDFNVEAGEKIRDRLKEFMEEGLYSGIFNISAFNITENSVIGMNLYYLSEDYFIQQFYPNEIKFLEQFNTNLRKHQSICAGLIYALTYHLSLVGSTPKIFAVDNLDKLYKPEIYFDNINLIYNNLSGNNGVMISNFNFLYLQRSSAHILKKWLDLINTKIILPSDVKIEDLDKILGLPASEVNKLSKFLLSSRMFLINKNNEFIRSEFSIAAFVGIVRILSSKDTELEIYKKILEQYEGPPDNWVNHLYNALNT